MLELGPEDIEIENCCKKNCDQSDTSRCHAEAGRGGSGFGESDGADGKECHDTKKHHRVDTAEHQDVAVGHVHEQPAYGKEAKNNDVICAKPTATKQERWKVTILSHTASKTHHTNIRRQHRPTQDQRCVEAHLK